MDRTIYIFFYIELYMDRTIQISWHVDVAGVAGGRGGSRGSPGGRRAVRQGGRGAGVGTNFDFLRNLFFWFHLLPDFNVPAPNTGNLTKKR